MKNARFTDHLLRIHMYNIYVLYIKNSKLKILNQNIKNKQHINAFTCETRFLLSLDTTMKSLKRFNTSREMTETYWIILPINCRKRDEKRASFCYRDKFNFRRDIDCEKIPFAFRQKAKSDRFLSSRDVEIG